MLLQAASKYDINLPASIMIGDKISDMQAAQSAGIENRWFYVHGTDENTISQYQTKLIANLTDAIELINSGN
jgi:D-glycero-D-manno-heptose 1,7-bisphosphate phosphatase